MTLYEFDDRVATFVAQALGNQVRAMQKARFDSQENYGYGPIITCDTEEERSYIEACRSHSIEALRILADKGNREARLTLDDIQIQAERYRAVCEQVQRSAIPPGTRVKFVEPVRFSKYGGADMVTKRHGIVVGHVVSPVDCRTIYKVRLNKHRVINQDPANVEMA